jgi:hypothetical protein
MRQPRPGDAFAQMAFGRDPQECYAQGICVSCGDDATVFADTGSRREYEISVMCQKCQDDFFDEGLDSE